MRRKKKSGKVSKPAHIRHLERAEEAPPAKPIYVENVGETVGIVGETLDTEETPGGED